MQGALLAANSDAKQADARVPQGDDSSPARAPVEDEHERQREAARQATAMASVRGRSSSRRMLEEDTPLRRNLEEALEADKVEPSTANQPEEPPLKSVNTLPGQEVKKMEDFSQSRMKQAFSAPPPPVSNPERERHSIPGARGFLDSAPLEGEEDGEDYFDENDSYSDLESLSEVGILRRVYFTFMEGVRSIRWTFRNSGTTTGSGRLLERDNAYHQCTGKIHIQQQANRKSQSEILELYGDDWFHVVLSWPTWQLVLVMATIYTTNLIVFTGLYIAIDEPGGACAIGADPNEAMGFQAAFGFSLITSSTIGYGFPGSGNPFFVDCVGLVVIVYFQVIVSLLISALVVGMVLQRLGRADTRSHQVVFSNKACIRCIHGRFYLMFQVYDLDRGHPVVEAHIRCYGALHETDGTDTAHFQTRYMRLQNPNDELGGVLFLSVPCTVVHCIDQWSPLMPTQEARKSWANYNDNFVHNASNRYVFPSLILREADSECGNRDGTSCPICGESFPTDQHLLRHIRYMQYEESINGGKPVLRELAPNLMYPSFEDDDDDDEDVAEMKEHLPDNARDAWAQIHRKGTKPEDGLTETGSLQSGADDRLTRSNRSATRSPRGSFDRGSFDRQGRGVKVSHKTKVNRLLKFYADLSLPISHLDVDMNLLPTEELIMPTHKAGKKRKPRQTDLFSLFQEEQRKEAKEAEKAGVKPPKATRLPEPRQYFRQKTRPVDEFRQAIKEHVESSGIEIVVLVEGIEARSSNSFQARHSYTVDDIEFDKFFAPCMAVSKNGHAQVNLNSFHQMVPVPSYASEVIVQSHT